MARRETGAVSAGVPAHRRAVKVPSLTLAEFQCLHCGYRWDDEPGPTRCPACFSQQVNWLNYAEDFA